MGCRIGGRGFNPDIRTFSPPFCISFPFSRLLSLFSFFLLSCIAAVQRVTCTVCVCVCVCVGGGGGGGGGIALDMSCR